MSIIDGLSLIFAKNKGGGAAAASRRTKPVERREAKKELASKATLGNGTDLFPLLHQRSTARRGAVGARPSETVARSWAPSVMVSPGRRSA
jgi:hypothetical protein